MGIPTYAKQAKPRFLAALFDRILNLQMSFLTSETVTGHHYQAGLAAGMAAQLLRRSGAFITALKSIGALSVSNSPLMHRYFSSQGESAPYLILMAKGEKYIVPLFVRHNTAPARRWKRSAGHAANASAVMQLESSKKGCDGHRKTICLPALLTRRRSCCKRNGLTLPSCGENDEDAAGRGGIRKP